MQSEVATDIYQTCLMMRRRVAKIVQAKSFRNYDIAGVTELLGVIDFIDSKLEDYKAKYLKLKQKALKDIEKKKKKLLKEGICSDDKLASKEKKKEKKVQQKETAPSVDLLDLGINPQEQQSKDEKSEEDSDEEEKKDSGLKRLQAPPLSKLHVIEGMRNLKTRLAETQQAQPVSNIMDMLIDLDIKSEPVPTSQTATQPASHEGTDFFASLANR